MREKSKVKFKNINKLIKAGSTIAQACAKEGVGAGTYHYWKNKNDAGSDSKLPSKVTKVIKNGPIPVKFQSAKKPNKNKQIKALVKDFVKELTEIFA
jgi:hypothetical protein